MRSPSRSFIYALAFAFISFPCLVRSQVPSSDFTPKAYHLQIDAADLETSDTFPGAVFINITVSTPIASLQLHTQNSTLNESSIVMMKKLMYMTKWDEQKISNLSISQTCLNITFAAPLAQGDYSVYIEFLGYYQNTFAGFAKVGYSVRSEQKFLGVTAFEPTNARKVFPCYDVPGYRTKFTLEITVNRPHVAISSVRPTSVHNVTDTTKRVFLFDAYPEMPLHQLGWAVVDQTSYAVREETSTSTVIHTRAPYLYINQTAWANHLTARLVQAVGTYTGIQFNQTVSQSTSKIEQIVLPEFFVGSSEGYGFMSFSEESILVAPNKSSTRYIQDVGLKLARGVVQQWFGDIISIDAWNNIWLMKGLDQYLQYIIADSLSEMSDWELEDQAGVELTQAALALDSPYSHPLMASGDETQLVASAFDSLTKYKGGAIMRMLKDIFGSYFNQVMTMFITTSFTNTALNPTIPATFWNMLYGVASEQNIDLAQKTLEEIMEQWIVAPGYPVLSVTSNSTHFNISQSNSSNWWVPVTYTFKGSSSINREWLQPGGFMMIQIPSADSKWILLNVNQTGFYRVSYTPELWQALFNQLSTDLTQLPRLSRAQLIDDAFAIDPQMALQFTGFLRAETNYFPWTTALRHYEDLIFSMAGHSSYKLLQDYILDLMNGVIAETGFSPKPQDTHIDRMKRSLVLEKACQFGHQICIQKAVYNLRSWMAQTYYDPDLSPALLCAGVANSSTQVWHNVRSMYQYSVFPSVRQALLKSLTCTHNVDLLYDFLNNITSISNPEVNVKDKTILLQTLASKPFGAQVLLNWLVDRLQAQVNSTSETSTEVPESTPADTSTTPNPNTSSTPSPTNQQIEARLETNSTPGTVMPTEKLSESDVLTILDLIVPKLTTLEEGTKLDSFLTLGDKTGLSNTTLETMKLATQRIYVKTDEIMKLNGKLTTWLETEATTTTPTGETTKTSTQAPQPTHTTPTPSAAPNLSAGGAVLLGCLLAMCLRTPTTV